MASIFGIWRAGVAVLLAKLASWKNSEIRDWSRSPEPFNSRAEPRPLFRWQEPRDSWYLISRICSRRPSCISPHTPAFWLVLNCMQNVFCETTKVWMCDVVRLCTHLSHTRDHFGQSEREKWLRPSVNGSTCLHCGMIEWHSRFADAKIESEIFLTNKWIYKMSEPLTASLMIFTKASWLIKSSWMAVDVINRQLRVARDQLCKVSRAARSDF